MISRLGLHDYTGSLGESIARVSRRAFLAELVYNRRSWLGAYGIGLALSDAFGPANDLSRYSGNEWTSHDDRTALTGA
jgi:hypothetical protein